MIKIKAIDYFLGHIEIGNVNIVLDIITRYARMGMKKPDKLKKNVLDYIYEGAFNISDSMSKQLKTDTNIDSFDKLKLYICTPELIEMSEIIDNINAGKRLITDDMQRYDHIVFSYKGALCNARISAIYDKFMTVDYNGNKNFIISKGDVVSHRKNATS